MCESFAELFQKRRGQGAKPLPLSAESGIPLSSKAPEKVNCFFREKARGKTARRVFPVVFILTSTSLATFLFDARSTKRKVNKREMRLKGRGYVTF